MVSERLVGAVRDEDTVARLGGDEFIVALWHVGSAEDAAMIAAKVIEVVSQPYEIEGHTISITTSVGVGLYPTHGWDAVTLMESADLPLYEAKRAGKNAFRISKRTELPEVAVLLHQGVGLGRGEGTMLDLVGRCLGRTPAPAGGDSTEIKRGPQTMKKNPGQPCAGEAGAFQPPFRGYCTLRLALRIARSDSLVVYVRSVQRGVCFWVRSGETDSKGSPHKCSIPLVRQCIG
jgi:hypothetical protein